MPDPRPSWQTEPCPAWCVRVHSQEDHPDDRAHVSEGVVVPAIEREVAQVGGNLVDRVHSLELTVGLYRGGDTTWVYVGDDQRRGFEISLESAGRLQRVLDDVLRDA